MHEQKKGLFCVIEGMDGSGKSTLLATLRSVVEQGGEGAPCAVLGGRRAVFLAEPTRLPTGIELRRRLSQTELPPTEEWIEMFRADRQANLDMFVLPALRRGDVIFQDRYYYSTAAYQGAFSDLGPGGVLALFDSWCLVPDLLVYLDVDSETAFLRMADRGGNREVFEERDRWLRIRDAYEEVLPAHTLRLSALWPPSALADEVLAAVGHCLSRETSGSEA